MLGDFNAELEKIFSNQQLGMRVAMKVVMKIVSDL
jgi:hypothetical protein